MKLIVGQTNGIWVVEDPEDYTNYGYYSTEANAKSAKTHLIYAYAKGQSDQQKLIKEALGIK
jgi:hypothetical protein